MPVGPGADGLAEALGVAAEAAVGVGRFHAHGAGRHAVGELQQQVAAVDAVERFEAAFEEVMADFFGAVGGAVDADDFGRRVGAEAEGAVLGARLRLLKLGSSSTSQKPRSRKRTGRGETASAARRWSLAAGTCRNWP